MIDVSPDRRYSTIGVAGELDDERTLIMALPLRGTNTVIPRVKKLLEDRDIVDVAITGGAARALEGDLVKAGIDYAKLGTSDMAAAYATLQEAIKAGSVAHIGQDELDTAMMMAKTRFWMTGEAEVFDRRGYSADVSPAVACSAALYRWGLQQAPLPVII